MCYLYIDTSEESSDSQEELQPEDDQKVQGKQQQVNNYVVSLFTPLSMEASQLQSWTSVVSISLRHPAYATVSLKTQFHFERSKMSTVMFIIS